ncbi:sensor histidine kinase [Seohaeicola zhoushanensis]|uniref:histidine kinase n=2 Tax=Seohaeicola zhoushanensis TaxID=1569283 RepID=A0A8J3M5T9_9RHOB|nr:HAMP domain-containing sensor histidine kinase [Seohaeicola zhoushanensis]GHF40734.1 hypothetical protein GCM10017056_10410 [Seohaeicola zhoushanensis]
MTPERQLKRNIRVLTLSLLVVAAFTSALFAFLFLSLRQDQARLGERQLRYYTTILDQQQSLGYGGLIHNFKNWVLRPDEPRYREAAVAAAERSMAVLNRLAAQVAAAELDLPLGAQRAMIAEYRAYIDVITRMHREGRSASEIDAAVRVSDDAALAELAVVRARVEARMKAQQLALDDRNLVLFILPYALAAMLSLGLLVLMRQRARMRLEHDARRIEEIEQFTQVAAHDLRAPLRQIAALAEFATEDAAEGSAQDFGAVRTHLGAISERAALLDSLIKAVFRYILIEGAAQEISEVDLRQTVDAIVQLHVPPGVSVRLEGTFPVVRAQRVELEIILRNLISNAVKHHPQNRPDIIIRYQADRRIHRFEVEDNGPGIPGEHAGRVFDMFWTMSKASKPDEVSGVGLALVRRIVTRWGTQLSLRPAQPSGAVFCFSMPRF